MGVHNSYAACCSVALFRPTGSVALYRRHLSTCKSADKGNRWTRCAEIATERLIGSSALPDWS